MRPRTRSTGISAPSRARRAGLSPSSASPLLTAAARRRSRRRSARRACCSLYLLLVVGVAAVGGLRARRSSRRSPASCSPTGTSPPPIHTFTIAERENLVASVVFVVVGAVVGMPGRAAMARRKAEALRRRAEAETLAALGATLVSEQDPLPGLMAGLRTAFGCVVGRRAPRAPTTGGRVEAAPANRYRPARRMPTSRCRSTTAARARARRRRRRRRSRGAARRSPASSRSSSSAAACARKPRPRRAWPEANELRTALLAAVSHDLRTPLASIKAAATSLLQHDVEWTADATARSCSRRSTRRPTGSTRSSATCST